MTIFRANFRKCEWVVAVLRYLRFYSFVLLWYLRNVGGCLLVSMGNLTLLPKITTFYTKVEENTRKLLVAWLITLVDPKNFWRMFKSFDAFNCLQATFSLDYLVDICRSTSIASKSVEKCRKCEPIVWFLCFRWIDYLVICQNLVYLE